MLRDQIQALAYRFAGGSADIVLPDRPLTEGATERLVRTHSLVGVAAVPPDLDEIAARLRETARSRSKSAEFRRRDLKYAPHCLWAGEEPIAEADPGAAHRIITAIVENGRRSLINTLAVAYLRYFRPKRRGIKSAGDALSRLAPNAGGWVRELSERYSVFDSTHAPDTLAKAAMDNEQVPGELLAAYGLSGDLLATGLAAEASRRGMQGIARRLRSEQSQKVVELADRWAFSDGVPRFDQARDVFIRTVVGPFTETSPTLELKQALLSTVLDRTKDPRLYPQNWQQVEEERDVVRRWLTGESLRQFLDIVDQVAQPSHWVYRRAFWKAFYDAGLLEEAWVAFASNGLREARRVFGHEATFGTLQQRGKAVDPGHAVLLMRMGNLTICDWSHNGRCIIWPKGTRGAPVLYKNVYYSGNLAPSHEPNGGLSVYHRSSANYRWQREISDFIRRKVGTTVPEKNFQVR